MIIQHPYLMQCLPNTNREGQYICTEFLSHALITISGQGGALYMYRIPIPCSIY